MGQDGEETMSFFKYFAPKENQLYNVDNSKKKINVLFLTIQINMMGGSERLVYNLVSKLDRKLFNPSVASFFGETPLKEFLDLGIPLFHIPKKRRIDFSTMHLLWKIIKANQIDVVNAHHFMSMVCAFFGCKLNKRHLSLIYTEHSEWELQRISWKWKFLGNHFLKHIDHAVGVNNQVTQRLSDLLRLPDRKTSTILNGVNLEDFQNNTHNTKDTKYSLNINNTEKVIGTVGNLKQVKNHVFLIKAFSELVKILGNVKLLIIGRSFAEDLDNSEHEVKDIVQKLGVSDSVFFLGYRSDVHELLEIMDVFCLTSLKEGLPISLIEAMAAGLPVIGTNVEGIRDVIVPNQNGLLVELGDIEGLTNALLSLLEHPEYRERLGQAARKTAEQKYSLDRCVTEYEKLFLSALPTSERSRQNKLHD